MLYLGGALVAGDLRLLVIGLNMLMIHSALSLYLVRVAFVRKPLMIASRKLVMIALQVQFLAVFDAN